MSMSREASWLSAGLQGEVVLPGQPRFNKADRPARSNPGPELPQARDEQRS
jgi:hypothetical protein